MNKADIELNKLRILLNAIQSVKEETDFYGELKRCAWNVLHENPGYGFDEWFDTLMEQYPAEIVDALGSRPEEIYASLAEMWDGGDYKDPETGECHAIKDWAEYFATDRSVELYDMLAEERRKIKPVEAR